MLGPAGKLIEIIPNTDYSKGDLIYSIHCTKTNECVVTIITIGDSEVSFPPGSFIKGAVYHMLIKRMIFSITQASFVGYSLLKNITKNDRNNS